MQTTIPLKFKKLTTAFSCLFLLFSAFCMLLCMTGCSKEGRLDEGDSICSITFEDVPKELSMLENNLQENFFIKVTLKNISNDRLYNIILNEANTYQKEISLHEGVYQVYGVYANNASNIGILLDAREESVTLSPDTFASVHVYVKNKEDFTAHWMSVQPMPEMILASPFDGLIQLNRKILNLRTDSIALINELDLSYDDKVAPYEKIELTDSNKGITLTLQNQTDSAADWKNCKVVGLYAYKNNVVFPQGVTLGMAPEKVCHKETGLYGEPNAFTGSLLYGMGFDDTSVIYNDPVSGDKITVNLGAQGSYIRGIRYELALFEE